MLDIQGTLVSLDLVERFFCCDLESCLGACCIEGDAGAPITKDEYELLKKILPTVWDDLLPRAQEEIAAHGVAYVDQEGDLVTNIIDGKNCVFTCYEPGGLCSCAIERAYRNGRIAWRKPLSCYLYPVSRWKICKCAEVLGRKEGLRVYQFLKEPLIERFGQAWYDELALTCEQYLKQFGD